MSKYFCKTIMAGIYLHIPFCKQSCHYCDFHFSTNTNRKQSMIETMLQELEMNEESWKHETIETIYFGGGTPSLLSIDEIHELLDGIRNGFRLNDDLEITLEANPDDLSFDYLTQLKLTPVNRLSIGIQSFQDDKLKIINRAHNAEQAKQCIINAQKVGFDNLSCDLIFGLPNQTVADVSNDLQTLLDFNINHLSCYSLTIEPNTAMANMVHKNPNLECSNTLMAEHFKNVHYSLTEAGFEHYEISNYATNKQYAKHNTNYWTGKKYLGIGPSAHSFEGNTRRWNISNNAKYINKINQEEVHYTEEELTAANQFNELVMTRMRTQWGMRKDILLKADPSFSYLLAHYINENLIEEDGNHIRLTIDGMLIADKVVSDFFVI